MESQMERSGDELWAVDLQIRSMAEIELLLYDGPAIARVPLLTIEQLWRAITIGSVGPDRTVHSDIAGCPGPNINARWTMDGRKFSNSTRDTC